MASSIHQISQAVGIVDPNTPANVLTVNSDGSINIMGTFSAGILVYTPLGYQQIGPGIAAATGLAAPVGSKYATITVSNQAVRWRDDGVDPTGTVGMPLGQDATLNYSGDLTAIKFIEVASGATLDISYYQ